MHDGWVWYGIVREGNLRTDCVAIVLAVLLPSCCVPWSAVTKEVGDAGCLPAPQPGTGGTTPTTDWPCDSCYSLRVWPSGTDLSETPGWTCSTGPLAPGQVSPNAYPATGPESADWIGSFCQYSDCGAWKDFPVSPGSQLKLIVFQDDGGCAAGVDDGFYVQEFSTCGWSDTFADVNPAPGPVTAYYPAQTGLVRVLGYPDGGFHLAVCAAPDGSSCAQPPTASSSDQSPPVGPGEPLSTGTGAAVCEPSTLIAGCEDGVPAGGYAGGSTEGTLTCSCSTPAASDGGWSFIGDPPGCSGKDCGTGYTLSIAGNEAEVWGHGGAFCPDYPDGIAGGMEQTFSITPGSLLLSFQVDARSTSGTDATNFDVRILGACGEVLYSETRGFDPQGDTGWISYSANLSGYVQGVDKVTVVLGLHDAWDADWHHWDSFSNVSVETCCPN